jgi:hypothetical protein
MAPEQAANVHAADIRADIYSLGCTLYTLLTGQVPFPEGTVMDKLMAHIERTPQPVSEFRGDVRPELIQVLTKMMAKDPAQRFQTPAEAAQALASCVVPVKPPSAVEEEPAVEQPAAKVHGHRRPLFVLAGAFAAAVVLVAILSFVQSGREKIMSEYMVSVYTVCALLGGTLLVCQFLLALLGFGHHDVGGHDVHDFGGHEVHDLHTGGAHEAAHDTQTSWYAGILTFRALVAMLTMFGLAGRTATAADLEPATGLALALAVGAATLFGIAWLMRSLYGLKADGTARIQRAVGHSGTVYLTVPGHKTGVGKVHLNLQNRTVEYQAVTAQEDLPTGAKVTVVAVLSPDTVEVLPASLAERIHHV